MKRKALFARAGGGTRASKRLRNEAGGAVDAAVASPWQDPEHPILENVFQHLLAMEDGTQLLRATSQVCTFWRAAAMEVLLADTAISKPPPPDMRLPSLKADQEAAAKRRSRPAETVTTQAAVVIEVSGSTGVEAMSKQRFDMPSATAPAGRAGHPRRATGRDEARERARALRRAAAAGGGGGAPAAQAAGAGARRARRNHGPAQADALAASSQRAEDRRDRTGHESDSDGSTLAQRPAEQRPVHSLRIRLQIGSGRPATASPAHDAPGPSRPPAGAARVGRAAPGAAAQPRDPQREQQQQQQVSGARRGHRLGLRSSGRTISEEDAVAAAVGGQQARSPPPQQRQQQQDRWEQEGTSRPAEQRLASKPSSGQRPRQGGRRRGGREAEDGQPSDQAVAVLGGGGSDSEAEVAARGASGQGDAQRSVPVGAEDAASMEVEAAADAAGEGKSREQRPGGGLAVVLGSWLSRIVNPFQGR